VAPGMRGSSRSSPRRRRGRGRRRDEHPAPRSSRGAHNLIRVAGPNRRRRRRPAGRSDDRCGRAALPHHVSDGTGRAGARRQPCGHHDPPFSDDPPVRGSPSYHRPWRRKLRLTIFLTARSLGGARLMTTSVRACPRERFARCVVRVTMRRGAWRR